MEFLLRVILGDKSAEPSESVDLLPEIHIALYKWIGNSGFCTGAHVI